MLSVNKHWNPSVLEFNMHTAGFVMHKYDWILLHFCLPCSVIEKNFDVSVCVCVCILDVYTFQLGLILVKT